MTDRQGVSETFCSLPSSSAGYSRPVLDQMAFFLRGAGVSVTIPALKSCLFFWTKMASNACSNKGSLRLALAERGNQKAVSSKAPCLELREGKIRQGSSFLVLSPDLLKACGRSLQTLPAYDNEGRGLRLDALAKIRTD